MSDLIPTALVPVTAKPHPFAEKVDHMELPAGLTLAEIVDRMIPTPWLRSYAAVSLEGHLILAQHLRHVRPKAGKWVSITVVPQGGGGGQSGGKNTTATILSAVVMIAAIAATAYAGGIGGALGFSTSPLVAGGTASAASIAGSVIIAGGTFGALMAINGPLPPRNPQHGGLR